LLLLLLLLCCTASAAWQVMLADIEACKANGADGVVLGCLTPDGQVDVASTATLVQAAKQQVGTAACLHIGVPQVVALLTDMPTMRDLDGNFEGSQKPDGNSCV
jgi:copper homeostasis protein CutC